MKKKKRKWSNKMDSKALKSFFSYAKYILLYNDGSHHGLPNFLHALPEVERVVFCNASDLFFALKCLTFSSNFYAEVEFSVICLPRNGWRKWAKIRSHGHLKPTKSILVLKQYIETSKEVHNWAQSRLPSMTLPVLWGEEFSCKDIWRTIYWKRR